MNYVLFTYPSCRKCLEMKAHLAGLAVSAEVLDVADKEGRTRIRTFLPHIKRDEKGAIRLPTLVGLENGEVVTVVNSPEELTAWLRSRG